MTSHVFVLDYIYRRKFSMVFTRMLSHLCGTAAQTGLNLTSFFSPVLTPACSVFSIRLYFLRLNDVTAFLIKVAIYFKLLLLSFPLVISLVRCRSPHQQHPSLQKLQIYEDIRVKLSCSAHHTLQQPSPNRGPRVKSDKLKRLFY